MSQIIYALCIFLVSVISLVESRSISDEPLEPIIEQIFNKVNSYQVLKPVDFKPTLPFPQWAQHVGLYESNIRINVHGNELAKEFRNGESSVFDNDMFSTGWIITALLEADLYGKGAPELDSHRLQLSLEAINGYSNKNIHLNDTKTLVRTFWPQTFNKTTNLWYQEPINIATFLNIIKEYYEKIPIDTLVEFFKKLGLEKVANLLEKLEPDNIFGILDAFTIPPDFDDTYLNLGLGSTLKRLSDKYPVGYKSWLENNTDCQGLIDLTAKYAYKPFDDDVNKNTIDPRTYFIARDFILDAESKGESVSLISTWVQNIAEQRRLKEAKISMPFNVNNVDLTVSANAIYGITSASIDNINNFGTLFIQSEDLRQTYLNTTKFITTSINSNFSSRPDLALVYYPSRYNFLWYTSRTLFLLENEFAQYDQLKQTNSSNDHQYLKHFEALKDFFNQVRSYLDETFKNTVTDFFLENRLSTESDDESYFCDFIGQADTDILGKKKPSNDDCLFTTSQTINTLIATWTTQDQNTKKLTWKKGTAQNVRDLMVTSVNWLKRNALNPKFKAMNAFFSGSVKGSETLPFYYPTTLPLKYLNGTEVDLDSTANYGDIVFGTKGSISKEAYEKLLQEPHFGKMTPLDFHGYNSDDATTFWSSKPYTHAVSLLALAQFNNLS